MDPSHEPSKSRTTPAQVTRLAPSPTGALHLGNIRTFAINHALAVQHGWRIIMRIEDLDTPRVKPGSVEALLDTLAWLGFMWTGEPMIQTRDLSAYRGALDELAGRALAFPCTLSRAEVESAASAPHGDAAEVVYPRSLRPVLTARSPADYAPSETNWRFAMPMPESDVRFVDGFLGPLRVDPSASVGDFVIWTKRDLPAYQLAVVIDDHRRGVTQIVRGDDLVDSTARQLLLYRALGLTPEPTYTHVPLVLGEDGKRLAKRHGDTRIDMYRAMGVPAEAVLGLIAHWSVPSVTEPTPMSLSGFTARFRLADLPREPAVFREEHDRWLRRCARPGASSARC